MKLQIKEFARLTGVSVRTLHYYDEIGLLRPGFVDAQNNYRFYDEKSLERMQEILFYRELDFSLSSIAEILAAPNYDKQKALAKQKHLLMLKKDRLERLIKALEQAERGEININRRCLFRCTKSLSSQSRDGSRCRSEMRLPLPSACSFPAQRK